MALITTEEIIAKAPVNHRPDPNLFEDHIDVAERRHVKAFLGEDWWDDIVEAADGNGGDTLTGVLETFWDQYLHEICALAVLHESLPFISAKIDSAGISKSFGPNTNAASVAEERRLAQAILDRIQFLIQEADVWLTDDSRRSDYPDYPPNNDDAGECSTSSAQSFSDDLGVVL